MEAPAQTGAFFAFAEERESIRLRKQAGDSRPWTDDPILREFKFTNVRRHHDWTTTNLRDTFYSEHRADDRRAILMNCGLFRYFGTFEFAEAVGWQDYDTFDFEEIVDTATRRLSSGRRVFTGAYVITNQGMRAPKQEVVVNYFMRDLHAAAPALLEVVQMTRSWRKVAEAMSKIGGFGGTGFMSKEILLDTMMTDFWEGEREELDGYALSLPVDYGEWTPIGPGGLRGAARLCGHERPEHNTLRPSQALEVILKLTEIQGDYWPEEWGRLHPTDIQFQLCEFDKYERVRLGQGRPRSRYRPR